MIRNAPGMLRNDAEMQRNDEKYSKILRNGKYSRKDRKALEND